MKKFSYLLLGAMAFAFASCGSDNVWDKIEYVPFQAKDGGNWGLISTDGKVLFESEFKNDITVPFNDRFFVQNKDNEWEIYKLSEKPEAVGSDTYVDIAPFFEDVTPAVKKDSYIYLINRDGEPQGEALKKLGGKEIESICWFQEGVAVVEVDGGDNGSLYGAINTNGEMIIEPVYSDLENCSDGKLVGINKKYADKDIDEAEITVLDKGGDIIKAFKIKNLMGCSGRYVDGVMVVVVDKNDDRACGLINEKGEFVLEPSTKVEGIEDVRDGKFIYSDGDGGEGLMSFDGEVLLKADKYDSLSFVADGVLCARENGNREDYKLINFEGEQIGDETFDREINRYFASGYSLCKTGKKTYGFIDKEGKEKELEEVSIYGYSVTVGDYRVKNRK